ncbi:hypothetical protein PHMEG_0003812 [Phytophthora megakarya]|uniref:Uncharacterized protein n=1 Tax=Phytophthora megakarya TaxID=4795 RepID=A0A225WXQ1_9STRA|nr:hypothetical protein PHMEG_0003812 [Phytophthora megakarya]
MTVFNLLQASKKISDPSKFDTNTHLEMCRSNRGRCRHCQRMVPWTRARVRSHERANCIGISTREKNVFPCATPVAVYTHYETCASAFRSQTT